MAWIRRYKQKKLISKISVDFNFMFSSYACICSCVFHCSHRLLCLNKVSCMRLFVKIALISNWNNFSLIPFGELCFLEESYGNIQKIQILKILRAPSIQHQWVCLYGQAVYSSKSCGWVAQHWKIYLSIIQSHRTTWLGLVMVVFFSIPGDLK